MKRPFENKYPDRTPVRVRCYGIDGPQVIVLHGGPAAAGSMAPVARGLAGAFRVLEPLQRGSGGPPLGVGTHVADLHDIVVSRCETERVPLVGHSWGAMLALVYASEHPDRVSGIVLTGCGTFDAASREKLLAARSQRMDGLLKDRIRGLEREYPDPDARLEAMAELMLPIHSCELATTDQEIESFDMRAHEETWSDMVRLQEEGVYPAAFRVIEAPVLMLHGADDPHPGRMIRDNLAPHLTRLEYLEWERCGHFPWMERAVGKEFLEIVIGWLGRHSKGES